MNTKVSILAPENLEGHSGKTPSILPIEQAVQQVSEKLLRMNLQDKIQRLEAAAKKLLKDRGSLGLGAEDFRAKEKTYRLEALHVTDYEDMWTFFLSTEAETGFLSLRFGSRTSDYIGTGSNEIDHLFGTNQSDLDRLQAIISDLESCFENRT